MPAKGFENQSEETESDQPLSRPSRQAGILTFGRFLSILCGALLPVLVVRLLGKQDVGWLAATLLTYDTVLLLGTAGIPSATLYCLSDRNPEDMKALATRFLFLTVSLGCGLSLAMFGLLHLLTDVVPSSYQELVFTLKSFSFLPAVEAARRFFESYCIAKKTAQSGALFEIAHTSSLSLAILIPAGLSLGLKGIAWALFATGLIKTLACVLFLVYTEREVKTDGTSKPDNWRRLRWNLGWDEVFARINGNLDRYIVMLMFPAARFAEYRAGTAIHPLSTLPYSVGKAYLPSLVTLVNAKRQRDAIKLWYELCSKVSLVVVPFSVFVMLCADELTTLLFTQEYSDASPVLFWSAFLTMARIAYLRAPLIAAARSDLVSRATLLSTLINLAITLPLVYSVGYVGPAMGTAIAIFPATFLFRRYISIAFQVSPASVFPLIHWLKVVGVSILVGIPARLLMELVNPLAAKLCLSLVSMTILYLIIGLLTGLLTRDLLKQARNIVQSVLPG